MSLISFSGVNPSKTSKTNKLRTTAEVDKLRPLPADFEDNFEDKNEDRSVIEDEDNKDEGAVMRMRTGLLCYAHRRSSTIRRT